MHNKAAGKPVVYSGSIKIAQAASMPLNVMEGYDAELFLWPDEEGATTANTPAPMVREQGWR